MTKKPKKKCRDCYKPLFNERGELCKGCMRERTDEHKQKIVIIKSNAKRKRKICKHPKCNMLIVNRKGNAQYCLRHAPEPN